MINHFNTREAIVKSAQNSDKIKLITDNIFSLFESDIKTGGFSEEDYLNAGKEVPQENQDLSIMDLYYGREIKDDDLSFLSGFLGGGEYVRENVDGEPYITKAGLQKLNHILDMASKHARRHGLGMAYFKKTFGEDGLGIMDFVGENKAVKTVNGEGNMAKGKASGKVYFHINNKEEYLKLLSFLTSKKEDNFVLNEKNGFFLKHIVSTGYLWRNDAYMQKRKLFQNLTTDVFGKFFGHEFKNIMVDMDIHGEHGHNITETFIGTINGRPTEVTLKGNVKSEKSTIDKIMREKKANATNDIIRFQLTFTNHDEMIHGLYDFLEFYKQDSGHVFDHESETFGSLKGFDKGGLYSENKFYSAHIDNLPEGDIKEFIKNINYNRKKGSSTDYKDVKLIVPVNLKGTPFNVEIKFITKDYDIFNDRGYSSHAILKGAEMIEFICRHKKFITEHEIRKIVADIIKESPELIDQIAKGDEKSLHEELFDYFINKCEKINIPGHDTVYMFKDIKDTLTKYSFWPHVKVSDGE